MRKEHEKSSINDFSNSWTFSAFFAADPTAVSDQPYFHHGHPMTWSGSMSVSLTNVSTKDADDAILKNEKRDYIFGLLTGASLTGGIGVAAGATGYRCWYQRRAYCWCF